LANYFAWARESELLALYSSEFRIGLQGTTAMSPMLDFLNRAPASSSDLERLLSLDQRFFLADHNLIYVDKMSMATGVEVRVPFLDLELVDYASRIPIGLKQRGSVGKWILKRAMEPYLPKDVIYRPKTGFGAPLRRWMRHDLRTIVGDILSPECLARRGLFDPEAVQRLIVQNERGNVDGAYTLFSLLTIEIWCRAFLDGAPADRPA
jgi:asparagine synthase (glutamine-hydrolysing)